MYICVFILYAYLTATYGTAPAVLTSKQDRRLNQNKTDFDKRERDNLCKGGRRHGDQIRRTSTATTPTTSKKDVSTARLLAHSRLLHK